MAKKHAPQPRAAGLRPSPEPVTSRKLDKLIPVALALAGAAAYHNSFRAPFLFDDRYHIVENTRIRQLWPPWDILSHSSRPMLHLSLALNYAIGGLNTWGYHLFNLIVHVLASLVLFGIVRRSFVLGGFKPGTAASGLAGVIALIWLVHPIQTESVTYVIQRSESLMGLFYFLTLYCAIRMAASSRPALWLAGAAVSLLCGVGTKGGVILTAPLVVLLYDRVFLARSWKGIAGERGRLYVALAAACLAYPFMLVNAPEEWKESAGFGYGASPLQYAAAQPGVIVHYIRLSLWPTGLCLDYGWPLAVTAGRLVLPLLAIAGALAGTIWAWRRLPGVAFAGAWFFVILAPTSSFIPIADAAAEHRMYLPLAALTTGVVLGVYRLTRNTSPTQRWTAAALVILVLTGVTIRRNTDYESKISIWQDTVRTSPGNPRAQYDLGVALEEANRHPEAIVHYRLAVAANPQYADALNNLGHALVVVGKGAESLPYLRRAVAIRPDLAVAHNNVGIALAQGGEGREAVGAFREALRLKPDFAEAHNNLGITLAQLGRITEAIAEWEAALRIDAKLSDANNNLAFALAEQGRKREAMQYYERALANNPNYYQAAVNYAKLLADTDPREGGNPERAATLAQQACNVAGGRDPECLRTLAEIYAKLQRTRDAEQTAQRAMELALAAGRQDLARDLSIRLERYRSGR